MTAKPRLAGFLTPWILTGFAIATIPTGPAPARAAETATLEGDVDFSGVRLATAPVPRSRYPSQSSTQAAAPPPPLAVVYIEGNFGDAALAAALAAPGKAAPVLNQVGLRFVPHLLPVVVGGTVFFPNSDDTYHNVFSYSSPRKFDLGRYLRGEDPPSVLFDKPGVAKIFCEVHHHMRATILVLDTPFFTLTNEEGAFRIQGIPAGRYKVTAWIDERNVWSREVTLQPGGTARLRFTGS